MHIYVYLSGLPILIELKLFNIKLTGFGTICSSIQWTGQTKQTAVHC